MTNLIKNLEQHLPHDSLSCHKSQQGTLHRMESLHTASRTCRHQETTSRTLVHTDPDRPPLHAGFQGRCSLGCQQPQLTAPKESNYAQSFIRLYHINDAMKSSTSALLDSARHRLLTSIPDNPEKRALMKDGLVLFNFIQTLILLCQSNSKTLFVV